MRQTWSTGVRSSCWVTSPTVIIMEASLPVERWTLTLAHALHGPPWHSTTPCATRCKDSQVVLIFSEFLATMLFCELDKVVFLSWLKHHKLLKVFYSAEGVLYCVKYVLQGSTIFLSVLNPGAVDATTTHRFTCYVSATLTNKKKLKNKLHIYTVFKAKSWALKCFFFWCSLGRLSQR